MNVQASVDFLKAQITDLVAAYPELADDDELRADMIEGETSLDHVIDKLLTITLDAEAMECAIAERISDMNARKARFVQKAESTRGLILSVMNHAEIKKLQLPLATLSTNVTKPRPVIIDEAQLPESVFKIERKPSLTLIKEAIEAGQTIEGVAMSNGKPSLTIRTK